VKSCTTCASPLYSDVKYCPFCGNGTTADAGTNKPAPAPVTVTATVDSSVDVPVGDPVVPAPRAKRTSEPVAALAQANSVPPIASEVHMPEASPVPASKAVRARGTPTSPAVDIPPVPPKKGGTGKWVVLAVILGGLFFYFKGKPDQNELSCNAAYDAGNKALLAKDIVGARSQALIANGVCAGASRSKLQSLQTAIESAESIATGCMHSFGAIDDYLDDHKLTSARNALNQLSSMCSADSSAEEDRKKLSAAFAATQAAQFTLREALDAKNLAGAKTAYGQLAGLNRENEDLVSLKNELDQLTADAAEAAEAAPVVAAPAPEPAPAQAVSPAPVRVMEAPRATLPTPSRKLETDNGANVKVEMAASFLRDAETALSQKKFDAAKTYVDSARRMDPNNPRLDSMLQQIRDREHQVLQQESTLR
jgi:HEPN domain-containing protein